MLRNYFTIAIRHMARHKMLSLINVLCIAIGITFSLLIGAYIMDQRAVNQDLHNTARQFVIKSHWKKQDIGMALTTIGPLAKTLRDQYPGLVANYFRYNPVTNVVSSGDRHFKENMAICDTTLVSMYGFPLLHGNQHKAFPNNNSAVITGALAIKLFGTDNAINKTITIATIGNGKQDYVVSGVLKDMSFNTVNNFISPEGSSVFLPFEGCRYYGTGGAGENDWNQIFMIGMIELQPGVSAKDATAAATKVLAANLSDQLKGNLEPELASLQDYYLLDNNEAVKKMLTTLSWVALFILLMAIINFVNINMGTASYRLREIGLRKVFGSARKQLVGQHLLESLVITFIAGLLSIGLYEAIRPYFNQALNTSVGSFFTLGYKVWGLLLLLVLLVGTVSGIYPAFVLSAVNIIHAVKQKTDAAKGDLAVRKTLLVVQFSLAIIVFIGAVNVSRQVTYFFNKDIGYNKDQLLVLATFPKQWDSAGVLHMQAVRDEMVKVPGVGSASLSFEVPDRQPPYSVGLIGEASSNSTAVHAIVADENFATTFGIQTSQGNFFRNYRESSSVKNEIVLNTTAAKLLGVKAPGGTIRGEDGTVYKVAGIVNDFNYSTFQQSIGPLAFIHMRDSPQYRYLTFKTSSHDLEKTIAALKDKWRELAPQAPFEYNFMDERFQSLYNSEVQLKKATRLATVLNLVIVSMGIFGVMAFTLARRNREIAVRKVLGAEAMNIVLLFFREYAVLIGVANLIAWPIAYWATNQWLQSYVYRLPQSWMAYAGVLGIVVISTFLFIAVLSWKTANSNPVRSLRAE